jgi:hypothetical protein
MSTQSFRFLDLAPEIRQKIYVLVCTSPLRYVPLDKAGAHTSFPLNLLLVSFQIYHEVRPVYFYTNSFSLKVRRLNDDWEYFFSPGFQDNRRQIRSLVVTMVRFGTKNFFWDTLIPMLEDCILNGGLRTLEFRVVEHWFNRARRRRTAVLNKGGSLEPTLGAIHNILADPYLEKRTLRTGSMSDLQEISPGSDEDMRMRDLTATLFET